MIGRRPAFPAVLLLAAACAPTPPVSTPAGFEILQSGGDDEAARQVARVLPGALERVGRWGTVAPPMVVRIQPSGEALAAAVGRPGETGLLGWARRGSVDIQSPRAWSRGRPTDEEFGALLAHELTHCLLFQRIGRAWAQRDVPGWFEEGMACFTAGERHPSADASALLPGPGTHPFDTELAYGTADRAFRYLLARHGDAAIRSLLDGLAAGRGFPAAFLEVTGTRVEDFEESLRAHLGTETAGTF